MILSCPAAKLDVTFLRRRIREIECGGRRGVGGVLPLGLGGIEAALPEGSLAAGSLHQVVGAAAERAASGGLAAVQERAGAATFVLSLLRRVEGAVVWCSVGPAHLNPLGLAASGFAPERLLLVEAGEARAALQAGEEALREAVAGAVVMECAGLDLTQSRRLQLAAEAGGGFAFLLPGRPNERGPDGRGRAVAQASAAATRWRVTPLPSAPRGGKPGRDLGLGLRALGLGPRRWRLELLRARGGRPGVWEVELCHETGDLRLSAPLGERAAGTSPDGGRQSRNAG